MFDVLELVWSPSFPWPLVLILIVLGAGLLTHGRGIGVPPAQPYDIEKER